MADIKQIKVGDTTYNIEPVTSYYKVGRPDFEMNSSGSLKGYGGFIDFHFFNSSGQPLNSSGSVVSSTPDYTSRIIEDSAGCININGTYIAWTGLTSGYIKSNGSIDATTFNENGTSLADKYAAKSHNHDGRYLKWAGSAANADAMGWGTLTANNGYTILSHASSSDGGDWGMVNKSGQIFMQLDGYYYQNEGQYRVLDTSDSSSFAAASHTHSNYVTTDTTQTINGTKTFLQRVISDGGFGCGAGTTNITTYKSGEISRINNTNTYNYILPNKNGTFSMTSDLSNYLPLSGGKLTGTLSIQDSGAKISFTDGWFITNLETGSKSVTLEGTNGKETYVDVTYKNGSKGSGTWYMVATASGNHSDNVSIGLSNITNTGFRLWVRNVYAASSRTFNINWIAIKYW